MAAANAALIFDTASGVLRRVVYPDTDAEVSDAAGPCLVSASETKTLLSLSISQRLNPAQLFALTATQAAQVASDGSANAKAGVSPQHSTLLDTVSWRPFWKVAGVDWGVGCTGVLSDWQSLSAPGLTISAEGAIGVRLDNVSGFVFQNIDFSLHGGTIVYLNNSNGTVFINCRFGGVNLQTQTAYVIQLAGTSVDLSVTWCEMDGAGPGTASAFFGAGGVVTVQYCWLKNFPCRVLETGNVVLDFRFNVIENGGMQANVHMNYLQLFQGTAVIVWKFNTIIQTTQASSGEGEQFYFGGSAGGTLTSADHSNNTIVVTGPGAMSNVIHGSGDINGNTPGASAPTIRGNGPFVANDNYFLIPGANAAFYPGSFIGWSIARNIDMSTGQILVAA